MPQVHLAKLHTMCLWPKTHWFNQRFKLLLENNKKKNSSKVFSGWEWFFPSSLDRTSLLYQATWQVVVLTYIWSNWLEPVIDSDGHMFRPIACQVVFAYPFPNWRCLSKWFGVTSGLSDRPKVAGQSDVIHSIFHCVDSGAYFLLPQQLAVSEVSNSLMSLSSNIKAVVANAKQFHVFHTDTKNM